MTNMTKKILFIILFLLFFILALNLTINLKSLHKQDKQVILLFNWGEYIDPEIINEYNRQSQKFVIKQSFFISNELAINKIKSGNQYDIAILSEYAIEELKQDEYLEKIDQDKIPKIVSKENFDENFKAIIKKIDENFQDYIIPYFWGKLGLLYNKTKITKEEIKNKWKRYLENPEYKIALYNNAFEGIFVGLKAIEGDISGNTQNDIEKAKKWLINLKQVNYNLSFITNQILDNMRKKNEERYDIALSYSGDARYLMEENENLEYYDFTDCNNSEEQGTNIWIDSLIIPKNSNKEGAYDFIHFLFKNEQIIRQNTQFIGYDSPFKLQPNPHEKSKLKLKIVEKDRIYKYNEDCKKIINNTWNEIYSYPRPKDNYLFCLSFFILFGFIILGFSNKIKIWRLK
ncbi:extracellular solute-binding protein [Candidatus Phytoplasma pini]|nr:extracellular solute-binding protein [Candidatus Phytoplasma pini]